MNNVVQPKKRRATVFSSYAGNILKTTVESKLPRFHVEIVRIIDPNRSDSFNIGDSDLIIMTIELTNPKELKRVEQKAKESGLPYFKVHRQIGEWESALQALEEREQSTEQAKITRRELREKQPILLFPVAASEPTPEITEPASVVTEVVPEAVPEPSPSERDVQDNAWIKALEEENQRLTEENKHLSSKVFLLEGHLRLSKEEIERVGKLAQDRLKDHGERVAEILALKRELDESGEAIRLLEQDLEEAEKPKAGVEQALKHFKELWKSGYLTPEEILKKIFKEG